MSPADGRAGAGEGRVVFDEFVFDKPLDEELFSFEPPKGYKVESFGTAKFPDPPADEDLQKPVLTPNVGIGPVKFGMSLDEVKKLLGEPEKVIPVGDRGANVEYYSRGYGMFVSETLGVVTINALSQPFFAVRVREFAGRTDKGVRIGSTEDDVRRAYGEPSSVDDPQEPGRPKDLYYNDLNGWFSLWKGKVYSMTFSIPRERKLEILEKRKSGDKPQ